MVTSGIVVNDITSSIVAENSGCNFEFNDVLNFLLTLALQAILNWCKKFLAHHRGYNDLHSSTSKKTRQHCAGFLLSSTLGFEGFSLESVCILVFRINNSAYDLACTSCTRSPLAKPQQWRQSMECIML